MDGLGPDPFYIYRKSPAPLLTPYETEIFPESIPSGVINPEIPSGQGDRGLLIYRANGTQEFFPAADILNGYDEENDDNWSLSFAVSNRRLVDFSTTAPVGTSAMPANKERYDGDASEDPVEAQTYYRIPVIRTISSVKYAFNITGIYRENTFCDGGRGLIVELIKIG